MKQIRSLYSGSFRIYFLTFVYIFFTSFFLFLCVYLFPNNS